MPGDDRKLYEFVAALPVNTTLIAIMLSSPGDNYVEGVNLATTVKNTGIKTAVAPNGLCASACFLMFAAGTDKFVFENARVGVHSASNASGLESTTSQAVTTLMARKAAELGVPPGIIGKMVTTPASQIAWLDDDDLQSMGVLRPTASTSDYQPGAALKPGSSPQIAATRQPTPTQTPPTAQASGGDPGNGQSQTAMLVPSLSTQQGAADRKQYKQWFASLQGEVQVGASWWAERRSQAVRQHLSCAVPGFSAAVRQGCMQAQAMLAPIDKRRVTEPEYRAGWNSF